MSQQQYSNHKKYYPPHHFILLPLLGAATGIGFYKAYAETNCLPWLLFGISSFAILFLAIMLRQHYALGNQNRIVRLEFRLRYFQFFNQSSVQIEKQLSFGQIAALRFASDDEFKILLDRAVQEKLSADAIKKSIKNWQADDMRV